MLLSRRTALIGGAVTPLAFDASAAALIFGSQTFSAGARQKTISDDLIVDITNNSLNSRMTCWAPTGNDILGLQIVYPGFRFGNPEQAVAAPGYTVTAAIEYPAGVFTPVFVNGSRTLGVPASEALYAFDFQPIRIPAGSQFWLKTFAQWSSGSFSLSGQCASAITPDWTIRGVGLTDQTLTPTAFTTTSAVAGFGPIFYAAFAKSQNAVGIIGDSIAYASSDAPVPTTNGHFFGRSLVGVIPNINLSRNGENFFDVNVQPLGRLLILSGKTNRMICELGRNDLNDNKTLLQIQTAAQILWAPYLARGFKVWQATLLPFTTSTDGWATRANQTVTSAAQEVVRLGFNAWIRANYVSLGLSGYLEFARAVDPTDSGVWNADGPGTSAAGFCTLSAGSVSACALGVYNGGGISRGASYPTGTVACTVRPYASDPGTVPVITATVDGSGVVTGFTVVSSGSGLSYPPMVAPNGAWTVDGAHPNARGYNEIIYVSGLGPAMFA